MQLPPPAPTHRPLPALAASGAKSQLSFLGLGNFHGLRTPFRRLPVRWSIQPRGTKLRRRCCIADMIHISAPARRGAAHLSSGQKHHNLAPNRHSYVLVPALTTAWSRHPRGARRAAAIRPMAAASLSVARAWQGCCAILQTDPQSGPATLYLCFGRSTLRASFRTMPVVRHYHRRLSNNLRIRVGA